jgi:hypothetical protein
MLLSIALLSDCTEPHRPTCATRPQWDRRHWRFEAIPVDIVDPAARSPSLSSSLCLWRAGRVNEKDAQGWAELLVPLPSRDCCMQHITTSSYSHAGPGGGGGRKGWREGDNLIKVLQLGWIRSDTWVILSRQASVEVSGLCCLSGLTSLLISAGGIANSSLHEGKWDQGLAVP